MRDQSGRLITVGEGVTKAPRRLAYLKNGDVVAQVERLVPLAGRVPSVGPDAFLADFLRATEGGERLLLSWSHQARRLRAGDTEVRTLEMRRDGGFGRRLARLVRAGRETLGLLLNFSPNLIVCGSMGMALWCCWMASRVLSVPLVFSLHNQLIFPGRLPLPRRLGRAVDLFFIRRADGAVCHGPFLHAQLRALGVPEGRIHEFDCGVRDVVESRRPAAGAAGQEREILYVGRVVGSKGVFDLLEACAPLLASIEDLRLTYVGNGEDLDRLRARVAALGLQSRVRFPGFVPHERMASVMGDAWLVVTPTRLALGEARCMTAMEALGLGVPVVAPEHGAFPYLIRHRENGMLYRPDDVAELARCIGELATDRGLYETMKQGAAATGATLLDPPVRFSSAIAASLGIEFEGQPARGVPA